jgi:hypothetical protein
MPRSVSPQLRAVLQSGRESYRSGLTAAFNPLFYVSGEALIEGNGFSPVLPPVRCIRIGAGPSVPAAE